MSALIDELKKDHSEIIDALNEVKELGILSKEGLARLMTAKARLLTHFQKEDEQFYPVLRKKLDLQAKDMKNVSRAVQEFFDKYSKGVLDKKFVGEFESLFVALGKRIWNEEDILYEVYEKLIESKERQNEKQLEDSKKEGKGL